MITARLTTQNSPEVWYENDPTVRVRADFPLSASKGTKSSAAVYFELEPGCALGKHIDSAEETLLILQGTVEVTVGKETAQVSEGEMALVPELVPHALRNIGTTKARVVGFFPSGHIIARFDEPYAPIGQQVFEF